MFNWYREARGVGKAIFPTRVIGSVTAATLILLYKGQVLGLSVFVYSYIFFLLTYPFLFFYLYKRSRYDRNVEMSYLLVDLFSVGICASLLDFAIVPSLVFLTVVLSTTAGLNGTRHFLKALGLFFWAPVQALFSRITIFNSVSHRCLSKFYQCYFYCLE